MKKTNGLGIASLILGIIGLLFSCIAIGIIPAIIGLILGIIGLTKKDSTHGTSVAGIVCSAVGIAIFAVILLFVGGTEEDNKSNVNKIGKVENYEEKNVTKDKNNVFNVGDIVETEDLRISFISAERYESDNMFIQPKEGYEYWKFEFKFENISDTEQHISSMIDWECYSDNSKVDQTYLSDDNGLDAALSSGRTTQGSVYFEIPIDCKTIEIEYNINYWNNDKIIFIGK